MAGAPEVRARGRTLESARIDLVDQISRHLGVYPGSITIADEIELPTRAEKSLAAARAARNSALEAAANSQAATAAAVRELTRQGLSLRDCGYLLGLSHGRVRQILEASGPRATKSNQRKKKGD